MSDHEAQRRVIAEMIRAGKTTADIRTVLNVSRKRIFTVRRMLAETGSFVKRHGGGHSRTKRTKKVIAAVRAKVKRNPRRSIRRLTREYSMSKSVMAQLVKEDLGMVSRAVVTKTLSSF
jgi:hypothetical protein